MSSTLLTIWTNAHLPDDAGLELSAGVGGHRLIVSPQRTGNLVAGKPDPLLAEADIAFGQPEAGQVISLANLRWIQLTTAGYTRYDRADLRKAIADRGAMLCNCSSVFSEPCAEHALAFMLTGARRIGDAVANKIAMRAWPQEEMRNRSHLLKGQTAVILGMGAIGLRLIELLGPLQMKLIGIRNKVRGDEAIETHSMGELDGVLGRADHVVNILPSNAGTDHLFDAGRFSRMKTGAIFYNIGRGSTVGQADLLGALLSGKLSGAYLDVTDPEPLPPENALWLAPNCYITPHTAGGHAREFSDLVGHFLGNLRRFENGSPLIDRIM